MKKNAQSISINTVVVATIALLVLVVVIVIFMNGVKPPVIASQTCATYRGICSEECDADTMTQLTGQKTECEAKNLKCCIPVSRN